MSGLVDSPTGACNENSVIFVLVLQADVNDLEKAVQAFMKVSYQVQFP